MNYKETEVSKMLKQCNDLIYSTTRKLFKTKSQNVKGSLQATLKFLNKAADEYALKRQEEIEAERAESLLHYQMVSLYQKVDLSTLKECMSSMMKKQKII